MNFINCKIVRKTEGYYAVFENYFLKLPERMNDALSLYSDKEVVLGIRPENISLANNNQKSSFEMYVDIAEMTGSDYYLYGKLGSERIIANVPSNAEIKSDTVCSIVVDTERLHIFDKVSENLICD